MVPCCASGLLTMPVLGYPESEWLWSLAVFLAAYNACPCSLGSEWLWCLTLFLAC